MRAASIRLCPACGAASPHSAVFCATPTCRKALGGFRFVREEMAKAGAWYEVVADRATAFVGRPQFLIVHLAGIAAWAAINGGAIAGVAAFDGYPFDFLAFILGVEALVVTGFLLISQNHQSAHADKRAELDYEVNVRTYREIERIAHALDEIASRLGRLEAARRDAAA